MVVVVATPLPLVWAQSSCGDIKAAFKSSECCKADLAKSTEFVVKKQTKRALLVIDTQYCFLQDSKTLPVSDSQRIIPVLNSLRSTDSSFFSMHIRSQDFHPSKHISFAPTFGLSPYYNYPSGIRMMCTEESSPDSCCPMLSADKCPVTDDGTCPNYDDASIEANPACKICFPNGPRNPEVNPSCKEISQAMWPDHCKSPFEGGDAGFPTDLVERTDDIIIRKGQSPYMDAYSAFQDNAGFKTGSGFEAGFDFNLDEKLRAAGIEELYVVGLAYDFCVAWSAKDAAMLGYSVTVIEDATAFIFDSTKKDETDEMKHLGVSVHETFQGPSDRRKMEGEHKADEHRRKMRESEISLLQSAGVKVVKSHEILEQMRAK